jgi:hypothetical protein
MRARRRAFTRPVFDWGKPGAVDVENLRIVEELNRQNACERGGGTPAALVRPGRIAHPSPNPVRPRSYTMKKLIIAAVATLSLSAFAGEAAKAEVKADAKPEAVKADTTAKADATAKDAATTVDASAKDAAATTTTTVKKDSKKHTAKSGAVKAETKTETKTETAK